MKKLSWFNKVVYGFNIILIVLTILAYVLPFLAPKAFPLLSVLTLILPLFLILNALFFIYWLFQLKRQLILSGIILLLGITFINKFYKYSSNEVAKEEKDFTLMSYNVRLFSDCLSSLPPTHKYVATLNKNKNFEFCSFKSV